MTEGVDTWMRLAGLLPPAQAEEFKDCWAIGEQEAGLGLLVSGILSNEVAISETVRAQLSVLAETWGGREALAPRIRHCRGDGQPASAVTLIEQDDALVSGETVQADRSLAGLVLVPWIGCRRCGEALMRVHIREDWGGLSYLAEHYAITTPARTAVVRLFPTDAADKAFISLLQACGQSSTSTDSTGVTP
ncbi:hypothetical protein DN069_26130 [Streptacidiphilus pinicola]|uniref:Uncharacterized protein n=1 Tax=Streptacidiphilus pinicola TaxID=2219663 RepID=A0A2X0IDU6_9ACTN|nr:hypothetical protein [Streptacidiphilus pinicola]RAG82707.1 hypothetical protein DN069_26130 [Streptacidiphilus pinicola]